MSVIIINIVLYFIDDMLGNKFHVNISKFKITPSAVITKTLT